MDSRARFNVGVVAVVAAGVFAGCASADADAACTYGETSVEAVTVAFLQSAQDSDLEAMQREVFPSLAVSQQDVQVVSESLRNTNVDNLDISYETPGALTRYVVTVVDEHGATVSNLEVGDMGSDEPGCFAVSYGTPRVTPDPSVSESATF